MHIAKPILVNVCVYLRSRDIDVPQHFLNAAQVGAAGEKMRRETMPQSMNGQVFRHTRPYSIFFDPDLFLLSLFSPTFYVGFVLNDSSPLCDIEFGSKNWRFYFPITSSTIVFVVLTLILWLIRLVFRK